MTWKNRNQRKRKRPGGGGVGIGLKDGTGLASSSSRDQDGKLRSGNKSDTERSSLTTNSSTIEATMLLLPTTIKNAQTQCVGNEVDDQQDVQGSPYRYLRIRVVQPYPFTFATFAKARWNGRTILNVYCDEFGSYPKLYYERAIAEGRILVNGSQVAENYLIKGGDELSHIVHRHEPAVKVCDVILPISHDPHDTQKIKETIQQPPFIKILYNTSDVIVVDKPPTMPIHPCGGYHFNSLFHILSHQDPSLENKLFTIHRLDRLTSGVTLIAKSTSAAATYSKSISERTCEKFYLARVKGRFPMNIDQNLKMKTNMKFKPPFLLGEHSEEYANNLNNANPMGNAALGYYIDQMDDTVLGKRTTIESIDAFLKEENLFKLGHFLLQSTDNPTVEDSTYDGKTETNIASANQSKSSKSNQPCWLHVACPCRVMKHKNGVCEAGDFSQRKPEDCKGLKPAETTFALIGYDAKTDSSLVMAKPLTGRTHQIRLHLQFMGHPIANDPNYGGEMFYADPVGQQACIDSKKRLDALDGELKQSSSSERNTCIAAKPENAITTDVPASTEEITQQQANHASKLKDESMLDYIKRTCVWCARGRGGAPEGITSNNDENEDLSRSREEDRAVAEFLVRSQGLWLHALQYRINGNHYTTDLPSWAECFSEGKKDTDIKI